MSTITTYLNIKISVIIFLQLGVVSCFYLGEIGCQSILIDIVKF